ncbi:MAG TPA: Hpt domain-containing protein, partial [Coleofasciculaceae cyanobacterium]
MIEDEELRNLYQISSEERLQQLEAGLRHLQKHPDDETTLKELRREAHALRGDSRGVGVEDVETLAYCFEKILGRIQRQQIILTQDVSDRLYQGLAAISLLVQEAVTAQPSGVNADEILELLTAEVLESQPSPQDASVDGQFVNNDEHTTASSAIAQLNENTSQLVPSVIEDEVLRDLYRITSLERLQNLETGLRQLTSHPDDEMTLDELYKEAHSLTGDSRTAGVEPVEILSHTLEQILVSIKQQQVVFTPDVSDRLYQGLVAINGLVQEAVIGQPSGVDIAEIIDRWMEVVLASQQLQQ